EGLQAGGASAADVAERLALRVKQAEAERVADDEVTAGGLGVADGLRQEHRRDVDAGGDGELRGLLAVEADAVLRWGQRSRRQRNDGSGAVPLDLEAKGSEASPGRDQLDDRGRPLAEACDGDFDRLLAGEGTAVLWEDQLRRPGPRGRQEQPQRQH